MIKLYQKNELNFALAWIFGYLIFMSIADDISRAIGVEKLVTLPVCIGMVLVLIRFLRKNGLMEPYGLCRFRGDPKDYLYFLPLVLMLSANLWQGIGMEFPVPETVLFVGSMLCVGFLEEVIFRGFLFRALCRDNVKTAVLISSVTFGAGHIVNLFNGQPFLATLLQTGYATAIGFLFTVIFWRGKSLWPCILAHGIFNSLSAFHGGSGSGLSQILTAIFLCVLTVGYSLVILHRTKP